MIPTEIRCQAPHPKVRGWKCRARLFAAVPGTVELLIRSNGTPPGCTHLVCPRCQEEYVVCPVGKNLAADAD